MLKLAWFVASTLALAVLLGQGSALSTAQPAPWGALRQLEGDWKGSGKGEPGVSTSERNYSFILGAKFLHGRNRTVYEPQEENSKGEVHQNLDYFSYDRNRKKLVLRQFHGEGFVNQYVRTDSGADPKVFVFETEAIENIPAGWKAKETYRLLDNGEWLETFELAAPGKEYEVYTETRLTKAQAAKGEMR